MKTSKVNILVTIITNGVLVIMLSWFTLSCKGNNPFSDLAYREDHVPGTSQPVWMDAEPNDTVAQAITSQINLANNGVISSATDVDTYVFTGTAGDVYTATLVLPSGGNYGIKVYDANGNIITQSTTNSITWTLGTTGTFYVQVYSVDGTFVNNSAYTLTLTLTPLGTVATPTFNPPAGTYAGTQSVAIISSTTGAAIYYTTNGTTPNCSGGGTLVSGNISITSSVTVKAIGCATGFTPSSVVTADYVINGTVAAPQFSISGGTYNATQNLILTTPTSGASIYYTVDGVTQPNCIGTGTLFGSGITVNASMTVQAIACLTGWLDSAPVSASYIILGVPAGLQATAGMNQIRLTWNAVAGATSYNIYWANSAGVTGASNKISNVTSPYDHLNLTYKNYYYIVAAVNNGVESIPSSEITLKPIALMGGTIQGQTMALSNNVALFAGAPSYYDGSNGTVDLRNAGSEITVSGGIIYFIEGHCIRSMNISTQVFTTIAGHCGTTGYADGTGSAAYFNNPQGITVTGGNIYVSDTYNNYIRKIVISTKVVTTLAGNGTTGYLNGTGTAAAIAWPAGIVTDGTNLFIGTTWDSRIRKIVISTAAVTTLAGGGGAGTCGGIAMAGCNDGTGTAATFGYPMGLVIDGTNTNLYVVDSTNHLIRKVVISTTAVSTVAGGATAGGTCGNIAGLTTCKDGTGTAAKLYFPDSLSTDGTNLYFTDTGNNMIRKIVIATGAVTTLAGGGAAGFCGNISSTTCNDGTGTAAKFSNPWGIAYDATSASLYIADKSNGRIRKLLLSTNAVSTISPIYSAEYLDGTGTAARFNVPERITTDGINLFVADASNFRVRKVVISTGQTTTLAGSGAQGSVDGNGLTASFSWLYGITTDGINVYVSQSDRIRKIVISTGAVSTLAGGGTIGGTCGGIASGNCNDGLGSLAQFFGIYGITTDGNFLYVTDGSNRIRKVDVTTGAVTTIAGSGTAGSLDNTGVNAQFNDPKDIVTDGSNLYVADTNSFKIRKIVISTGVVTTLAGNGAPVVADGTGLNSSFQFPHSITSDGFNLYVDDQYRIRKINLITLAVTTIAGTGTPGFWDGAGTIAQFMTTVASGISGGGIVCSQTNIFVSDRGNSSIRKIQ